MSRFKSDLVIAIIMSTVSLTAFAIDCSMSSNPGLCEYGQKEHEKALQEFEFRSKHAKELEAVEELNRKHHKEFMDQIKDSEPKVPIHKYNHQASSNSVFTKAFTTKNHDPSKYFSIDVDEHSIVKNEKLLFGDNYAEGIVKLVGGAISEKYSARVKQYQCLNGWGEVAIIRSDDEDLGLTKWKDTREGNEELGPDAEWTTVSALIICQLAGWR